MRTILFRGKKTDTKEWIFGDLIQLEKDFKKVVEILDWSKVDNKKKSKSDLTVIPETVGQYTGVDDKNGTKIFEHDIVKYERQLPFQNMFEINQTGGEMVDVNHVVEYFLNGTEFSLSPISYNDLMNESLACCRFMEVIGNVHDNLELLNTSF